MNDKTLAMILATAIAAPFAVVCCGGGLALLGSALAGVAGRFSGMRGGLSGLLAIGVGIFLLAMFWLRRPEEVRGRANAVPESR